MTTRRQVLRALCAAGAGITLAALPPALRAQEASVVAQGTFTGHSNHQMSGSGAIVERGGSYFVSLGTDFRFDGAPDPKVALGNGGYLSETLLGPLEADSGAQNYPIPGEIDAEAHTEIWIWCEEFDVPLGVAHLQ